MVSNQAPSSISINGWNQTLHLSHLLTAMVVSGFYHALYLSFSPQGCHVRWWRVFTVQGHPAKRVSGGSTPAHTLLNEPCMCPVWLRVSFTQRKEHIFLVYSKVQYGQPPLPCPTQSPSSALLCPFSPTITSLTQADLRATFPRSVLRGWAAAGSSVRISAS